VEANELNERAKQFYERGDWQAALELYEQALALGKTHADNVAQATALDGLGTLYCYRLGQRARAYELYEAARQIWHETGDAARESATSVNLAGMYQADGRYEEARTLLERVIVLDVQTGSPHLKSHRIILGAVRKRIKRLTT
jgi:tetratricopeptide (TPR) repeat protein